MDDYAERCRMDIPTFLAWCKYGEGEWWVSRLRLKWQIQAAAERQRAQQWERKQRDRAAGREGMMGGPCDPHEWSLIENRAEAEAA